MNSHGASNEFPLVDSKKTKGCQLYKVSAKITTMNPSITNSKFRGFASFVFLELVIFLNVVFVIFLTLC